MEMQPEAGERKPQELNSRLVQLIGNSLSGGVIGCYLQEKYPVYYINDQMLQYLDYTYDEFWKATDGYALNCIHPEDRQMLEAILPQFAEEAGEYNMEYRMLKKSGDFIWVRDTGKIAFTDDSKPLLISVCQDITGEVRLRYSLKVKNEEYMELMDSLPCGICKVALDENLTILYANRFFYGIFGYTPREALDSHMYTACAFFYQDDFERVRNFIQENVAWGKSQFELEHRVNSKNGDVLWVLARCSCRDKEPGCMTCTILDITDRKRIEEQLRVSEAEGRIAMQHTGKLVSKYEVATGRYFQPKEKPHDFNLPAIVSNMPQSVIEMGLIAEDSMEDFRHFFESMKVGIPDGGCTVQFREKGGAEFRWYEAKYTMIYGEKEQPQLAVISYSDVTERREKELAYEKWSQYFEPLRKDSIAYYEYNLTMDKFENLEGELSGSLPDTLDRTFSAIASYAAENLVYPEDQESYLQVFNRENLLVEYYSGHREVKYEHRRLKPDGTLFWAAATIQMVPDPFSDQVKTFVLIQNIDKKKRDSLKIQALSERDSLTGLYNRRAAIHKITEILKQSPDTNHTLIMLDVDHFKSLNDTFGHQFGDRALQDVAAALREVCRPIDVCGRIGGDEFVAFLYGSPGNKFPHQALERLCSRLSRMYEGGARVSGSLGVAVCPRDGTEFDELYRKADIALYEAKRLGRNQYVVYEESLADRIPAQV